MCFVAEDVTMMMPVCSYSDTADVNEEQEQAYSDYPIGPGRQFSHAEEVHSHAEELHKIKEQKFVVSETKLIDLFRGRCREPGCSSECTVKSKSVGCTMGLWWNCQNGHSGKWN